jgi:hypothetical protein
MQANPDKFQAIAVGKTLIKILQIGKIFFVTKNLENTNNILMTKKSRIA